MCLSTEVPIPEPCASLFPEEAMGAAPNIQLNTGQDAPLPIRSQMGTGRSGLARIGGGGSWREAQGRPHSIPMGGLGPLLYLHSSLIHRIQRWMCIHVTYKLPTQQPSSLPFCRPLALLQDSLDHYWRHPCPSGVLCNPATSGYQVAMRGRVKLEPGLFAGQGEY